MATSWDMLEYIQSTVGERVKEYPLGYSMKYFALFMFAFTHSPNSIPSHVYNLNYCQVSTIVVCDILLEDIEAHVEKIGKEWH
jgi:hypothetical protein